MTAAPNEPVLLRRDEGRVAILTLNRPHALNALSGELIDALQAEFDRLAQDKDIRCVIIEAKGRAFSTGHDLREVASSRDYAFHHDLLTRCSAMMLSIHRLPQPVIAKVQAIATAAGCQLVAACDLAVASSDGDLRHLGHQQRPVLRHALGAGRPQRRLQARARHAVHRPVDRRRDRAARRAGEPRRAARQARPGDDGARPAHRRPAAAADRHGQGDVPPAHGDGPARRPTPTRPSSWPAPCRARTRRPASTPS